LFCIIGRGIRVEGFPAGLAISRGSFRHPDCRIIHYGLKARRVRICNTRAYNGATTTETLCAHCQNYFVQWQRQAFPSTRSLMI
jgi:hypothetical protein